MENIKVNHYPIVLEVQFEDSNLVEGFLIKSQEDLWGFCGELAKEMHNRKCGYRYRIVNPFL